MGIWDYIGDMPTATALTGVSNVGGVGTISSAVAKKPHDASCLSVVSFNSTKRRVFLVFYC